MKNSKGITLLALIITIIVLVILAGVALNTLFGNNGILNNSEYATEQYMKSAEKEAVAMAFADLKMKLYTDDNITEITAELLQQRLNDAGNNVEVEDGENGNFVITFKDTGDQYEVASNGSIVGEEQTEVAQIPLEITGDIEATGGETTILVTVSTNVDSGATYIYHYQLEGGEEQTATSNSSTYTIEGLTVNNNYEVWVEAYNSYNTEHAVSEHVTVRTEYGPYITVPADFAYNGGTITGFNANAESGVATMARSGDRKVILAIPSEYDNNGTTTIVRSITGKAFKDYTNLISVIIPNNVTSMGYDIFWGCTNLTSATLSNGLTSLSTSVFRNCSNLEYVNIPKGITSIGEGTFAGCTKLTKVGNGIEKGIVLESDTTRIPAGLCYGAPQVTEVTIPNSVTIIGENAFNGCTRITEIGIPNSVTILKGSAFKGCTGITEIEIPSSVTTIQGNVFQNCSGLNSITIPNSVTSMGYDIFWGCTNLTSATLSNGLTSLSTSVFRNCSNLNTITIPSSIRAIGNDLFIGCSSLTTVTFLGTRAQWEVLDKGNNTVLTSATVTCSDD